MRTSSSGTFLLPSFPQAITLLEWTYSYVPLLSTIKIHFVKGNKKRRIHTYSKENEFWWNLFYGHRPLVRKPISGKHLVYASIHFQAKYIQHWCCLILRDLIWLHFLCSNFGRSVWNFCHCSNTVQLKGIWCSRHWIIHFEYATAKFLAIHDVPGIQDNAQIPLWGLFIRTLYFL